MSAQIDEIIYASNIPHSWRNCHGCVHLREEPAESLPSLRDAYICRKPNMHTKRPLQRERGIIGSPQNPLSWTWSCKEVGPSEPPKNPSR